MLVRYASFLTIALALLLPTESRSQHALNLPTLVNPTFLCDFQIEETFLFENGSGAVYEPFDSTLYKYDIWKRPERMERYLYDSLIGESKLEYDRVNKYTRITSLQLDTFYFYNVCGLITEKNISTGSSDPQKASFSYRYSYDSENKLLNRTLWDLKNYDTDFILEEIVYSYNLNGQVAEINTSLWLESEQLYTSRKKTIHYNQDAQNIVEKVYMDNVSPISDIPDSTTIFNYNDHGKITGSFKLIPNNGIYETIQATVFFYSIDNLLHSVFESNYNEGEYTYGQFWSYSYDIKQNLKLKSRSESFDSENWVKKDRVRYVVRGQYVPMASVNSIEVVPNPATCCADIIFYSDEYDLVKVLISDMTSKIVLTQILHIFPGRNIIPVQFENFINSPAMSRQLYSVAIIGNATFSKATFIKL